MSRGEGPIAIFECSSRGERNNGLIKKCTFEDIMPDVGYKYNCPHCSAPLILKKGKKTKRKK